MQLTSVKQPEWGLRNGAMMIVVRSPQTLEEADRRVLAAWAADCAEHVLGLFEREAPHDTGPRKAIARARAFARGELGVADAIRRRFGARVADRRVSAAALAAARAAGQAAAVAHVGAHALGAAAYAANAVGLTVPGQPDVIATEIRWQFDRLSEEARAALKRLPPVGETRSGPLGPGLLSSGALREIICVIQAALAAPAHVLPARWPFVSGQR